METSNASIGVRSRQNLSVNQTQDMPPWLRKLGDPKILRFKTVKKALFGQYKLIDEARFLPDEKRRLKDLTESEFQQFILNNKDLPLAKELLSKKSGWTLSTLFTGAVAVVAMLPILLSIIGVTLNLAIGAPNIAEFMKDPAGYSKQYAKEFIFETGEKLNGPDGGSHKAVLKKQTQEQKQEKLPQDNKKNHR